MSRTARLWKGAGSLTLGGLLLSGVARADDAPPSLADQLVTLGQQAKAQGKKADAAKFFAQALKLDPKSDEAKRGLDGTRSVRLAGRQDPGVPVDSPDQPATSPPADRRPGGGRTPGPRHLGDDRQQPADPENLGPAGHGRRERPRGGSPRGARLGQLRRRRGHPPARDRGHRRRPLDPRGHPKGAPWAARIADARHHPQGRRARPRPCRERPHPAGRPAAGPLAPGPGDERGDGPRPDGPVRHPDGAGAIQHPVQRRDRRHRRLDRPVRRGAPLRPAGTRPRPPRRGPPRRPPHQPVHRLALQRAGQRGAEGVPVSCSR